MTQVKVIQLTPMAGTGTSFLNVEEDAGMIGVWTHAMNPTFLVTKGFIVHLLQFDDELAVRDFFELNETGIYYKKENYTITRLGK